MALEQKVNALFEQLTSYADQGLGALGRAQEEIQALKKRNQELEQRIQLLEGKLGQLKEKISHQLHAPEGQDLLSRPDALMMLIRETLDLEAEPVAVAPTQGYPELEALNPQERLQHWVKKFPRTFMPGQPQPLKIGIHEELLEAEGGDPKKIRRALAGYVKVPRYLRCLKAGAVRLDLQGANAGFVTQQEAEHAQQQLDAWEEQKKQKEARKKQQQQVFQAKQEEQRLESKLQQLMQLRGR